MLALTSQATLTGDEKDYAALRRKMFVMPAAMDAVAANAERYAEVVRQLANIVVRIFRSKLRVWLKIWGPRKEWACNFCALYRRALYGKTGQYPDQRDKCPGRFVTAINYWPHVNPFSSRLKSGLQNSLASREIHR